MSGLLSKAVNNSTWTAIGSLMTAVLGFLFAGLTIRWLGASEAGFAIAITTIAGIKGLFSGLGLGSAATRLISRAHEENNRQEIQKIAGVCLCSSLFFGLLGFSIFALGSPWMVEWSKYQGDTAIGRWYCIMLGLSFGFQQLVNYFDIFFISFQRYDWQTKINTLFLLANGILGITLLKAFPSILTLGYIQLGLSFLNCLCAGLVVTKLLGFITYPSWNTSIFKELWDFGKWVYLTQLTTMLMNGMDKIFLTTVFGSASLPFYTFAQRIYINVHMMLGGQSSYLFPLLSAQGKNIEIVAEKIEDRMRWIIGLISSFIYAGLIIAGPALLTIMVNSDFSRQASFQLLIFCWVGYIHANGIVQFLIGLSKGDSKGNWIYHMIIGFAYLPLFVILAYAFGFKYAVVGQLMTLLGTIYLSHRLKPKMNVISLTKWILFPLYSSLSMIVLASIIHLILHFTQSNIITQIITTAIFYVIIILVIFRLELLYVGGKERLETLSRAISMLSKKLKISDKLILNVTGIKSSYQT